MLLRCSFCYPFHHCPRNGLGPGSRNPQLCYQLLSDCVFVYEPLSCTRSVGICDNFSFVIVYVVQCISVRESFSHVYVTEWGVQCVLFGIRRSRYSEVIATFSSGSTRCPHKEVCNGMCKCVRYAKLQVSKSEVSQTCVCHIRHVQLLKSKYEFHFQFSINQCIKVYNFCAKCGVCVLSLENATSHVITLIDVTFGVHFCVTRNVQLRHLKVHNVCYDLTRCAKPCM